MLFTARLKAFALAAVATATVSLTADAAILKQTQPPRAGTTTTATTSGQSQILTKFDPYNVVEFSLDVYFEAEKVEFVSLTGLNGYVIESYEGPSGEGNFGTIQNIYGYFPGFGGGEVVSFAPDNIPPVTNEVEFPPFPPGNADLFQILWNDLNKTLDKTFYLTPGPDNFITFYDPVLGDFVTVRGDQIDPSQATIFGINGDGNGGPNGVPLPPAVWAGLISGACVVGNRLRQRRATAA